MLLCIVLQAVLHRGIQVTQPNSFVLILRGTFYRTGVISDPIEASDMSACMTLNVLTYCNKHFDLIKMFFRPTLYRSNLSNLNQFGVRFSQVETLLESVLWLFASYPSISFAFICIICKSPPTGKMVFLLDTKGARSIGKTHSCMFSIRCEYRDTDHKTNVSPV